MASIKYEETNTYLKASSAHSLVKSVAGRGLTTPVLRPSDTRSLMRCLSSGEPSKRESRRIPWNVTFFRKMAMPGGVRDPSSQLCQDTSFDIYNQILLTVSVVLISLCSINCAKTNTTQTIFS